MTPILPHHSDECTLSPCNKRLEELHKGFQEELLKRIQEEKAMIAMEIEKLKMITKGKLFAKKIYKALFNLIKERQSRLCVGDRVFKLAEQLRVIENCLCRFT